MDRRSFLHTSLLPLAAWGLPRFALPALAPPAISMCDWNLGRPCDPERIPVASELGLSGIQVSVGTRPDSIPLRDAAVRQRYLELGQAHGIAFNSVAAGGILNRIPLQSEPQAAVYVIDAVEAAAALGAPNILVAFFSNGDLRLRDSMGEFRDVGEGSFSEYVLDTRGVDRVVDALRQIMPRAEDLGVQVGLENTLTARQNLEILERVDSPMLKVYYDVGNSTAYGYDVPAELRLLGNDLICEIHLKEHLGLDDPEWGLLGAPAESRVDFQAVADACRAIGYDKWYVLESSGRRDRFEADTRANVAFVTTHFSFS